MNDLEKVTKRSYGMIAYAGMSESLPNLCYYNNEEYQFSRPYSEHTAELIDLEVKKLIAEQYDRAKRILEEHKEGHAQLAQLLIEREVIYAEDVENIFGKRPWMSRTEELLAANEADKDKGTDEPVDDHAAENEEIIRKKVVEAVIEKAKNGQGGATDENKRGKDSAVKSDVKPFRELKVTTSGPASEGETVHESEVEVKTEPVPVQETSIKLEHVEGSADVTVADESSVKTETDGKVDGTVDGMRPIELPELMADDEVETKRNEVKTQPVTPHENTLFGW